MRQKVKRRMRIAVGIWLLALTACSFVLLIFFPELINPASENEVKK